MLEHFLLVSFIQIDEHEEVVDDLFEKDEVSLIGIVNFLAKLVNKQLVDRKVSHNALPLLEPLLRADPQSLDLPLEQISDISDSPLILSLLLLSTQQMGKISLNHFKDQLDHSFMLNLDFPVLCDIRV